MIISYFEKFELLQTVPQSLLRLTFHLEKYLLWTSRASFGLMIFLCLCSSTIWTPSSVFSFSKSMPMNWCQKHVDVAFTMNERSGYISDDTIFRHCTKCWYKYAWGMAIATCHEHRIIHQNYACNIFEILTLDWHHNHIVILASFMTTKGTNDGGLVISDLVTRTS